jgi:O-antigen/teichoic acid export membrane protein
MRRLASDSLIYGLGSVANQALAIVLLPLYTRYLTPDEYGSYALLTAAGAVLMLAAALGVDSGLTRIFFLYERAEDRGRVVFTAYVFALASSALMAGCLLLAAPAIDRAFFAFSGGTNWVRLAIVIFSLSALNAVALGTLQVQKRAGVYVTCSLLGLLSSCGTSIWLVAGLGRGVVGVLEGQLVGVLVQVSLALGATLRTIRPRFDRAALSEMLGFSLPLLPANLAAWGLGLADRWFLKHYASLTDLGLYALGFRFGSALGTLFVSPFSLAWFPYLYSITNQPDHREVVARVLEYFGFLAGAIALGLALFGSDVIRWISDPAFQDAERVIFWIGLGILFRGMTFITMTGMNVVRRNQLSVVIYGVGVALNLALLAMLVPRFGMMGAAAATVATYFTINLGFWRVSQRLYPIPFRPLKIAWLVAVLAGLYALSRLVPPAPLATSLALKALVLLAYPAILAGSGFFAAGEFARARELVRRFRPA